MKLLNKGFSLIEVVIATSIITISVFGVYKLIGENTKIITNSSNYLQVNSLFPIVEECLEETGFSNFSSLSIGNKYSYFLGTNLEKCNHSTSPTIIDNIDYYIKSILVNRTSNYLEWEINIKSDETKAFTGYYKQIKK